jgi:hypothetical protein
MPLPFNSNTNPVLAGISGLGDLLQDQVAGGPMKKGSAAGMACAATSDSKANHCMASLAATN